MRNLARKADCDRHILRELHKASIPVVREGRNDGEVPATLSGRLGPFEFIRGWAYWRVRGLVPLHVAQQLYRHPRGRRAVRAGGHCACPHPKSQTERLLSNGGRVWPEDQRQEWEELIQRRPGLLAGSNPRDIFSDDPQAGREFVTSYHIDTLAGLRLFAKMIRRYGLHRPSQITPPPG